MIEQFAKAQASYPSDDWESFDIREVGNVDEFTPFERDKAPYQGFICPIPQTIDVSPNAVWELYNSIKKHAPRRYTTNSPYSKDVIQDIQLKPPERLDIHIPDNFLQLRALLERAFYNVSGLAGTMSEDEYPARAHLHTFFRVDSSHHTAIREHGTVVVASLMGQTTRIFKRNASGDITAERQLPPNSIAIFNHWHAAPELNGEPRANILCA